MKPGGPTRPRSAEFRRPIRHEVWGKRALRAIGCRDTLREKEIDLFNLRLKFIQNINLRPTILYIWKELAINSDLGYLAKSLLIEFGKRIGPVEIPESIGENVEERHLYHMARLLILGRKQDEVKELLNGRELAQAAKIRLILLRDPCPRVKNRVPVFSPVASR